MIELKHVSFAYQGQEHDGLHDINLTIADGECVLFCGRSGCGKTTITRLVNGLIPQFYAGELTGSVLVDGQEISKLPMYQTAAKVGSVFQNPRTQFFNVDTDSEIAFGIENEARPPVELAERVEQATDDLHISPLRNRNIFELSGGEKQKIAFASVYAMNPEIYLLDEPSSNLDMTSIQELKGHLRLLQKQGKTILIAEHRLYYMMDLADRIVPDRGAPALLSDGSGGPDRVLGAGPDREGFYAGRVPRITKGGPGTHGIAGGGLGGGAASASPPAGIFPCPGASGCHAPV